MSTYKKAWTLVTGGAKGLGSSICQELSNCGHNVLIHYNTSEKEAHDLKESLVKLGRLAECVQGDFSSQKTLKDFIKKVSSEFYDIAFLVNNVGEYSLGSFLDSANEQCLNLFQTNFHAPLCCCKALIPSIKIHRGAIINIGVAGVNHIPADTYSSVYTSTKLALWMATKSLAKELASFGVRVNMVSPGILDNAIDLQQNLHAIPMGRPGKLSEVAKVVAFLLDANSSYITGQNIEIAGGVRLR